MSYRTCTEISSTAGAGLSSRPSTVAAFSPDVGDELDEVLQQDPFPDHTSRKLLIFKLITQQMDKARKAISFSRFPAVNIDILKGRSIFSSDQGDALTLNQTCSDELLNKDSKEAIVSESPNDPDFQDGEPLPTRSDSTLSSDVSFSPSQFKSRDEYLRFLRQSLSNVIDDLSVNKSPLAEAAEVDSSSKFCVKPCDTKLLKPTWRSHLRMPWTIREGHEEDRNNRDSFHDVREGYDGSDELSDDPRPAVGDQLELDEIALSDEDNYRRITRFFIMNVSLLFAVLALLVMYMLFSSGRLGSPRLSRQTDKIYWPWSFFQNLIDERFFKALKKHFYDN